MTREWGGPDREQGEIVSRMGSFTPMNLPGEYDDLTADNIAGLTLAACFVVAERWDTFTAWCRQFYDISPPEADLLLAVGRADRLFTELDADDSAWITVRTGWQTPSGG